MFATNDAINELGKVDKTLQAAVDRNTADVAATRASQAAAADSVAQAIGGGAKVDAQGRIVMPEIHLGSLGTGVTQPTTLLGAVGALDSTVKATDRALKDVFEVSMEAEGLATKASRQLEGLGADEKVVDRIDEVKRNALMWDPSQKTYSATHADGAQNRISNVAAGVASTDAVNKGQLDGVGQAAADAQQAAAGAQRTADAAQGAAASAQQASAAARATAADAKAVADAARATAADAQRKADAADAKLAGIGDGETVAGKIDQAVQAAADKSDRNAGEALAAALGGGSTVGADGKASAPAYAVSQVGGDGAVTAPAPATTVGAAVAALDANVLKVNERVSAQGNDLDVLKQDVGNLRDDSLLWDAGAGAFSAAHGGTAPNRIVDVAAGQAETDAVNKGQLDGVAQTATAAQTAAGQAKLAAQGAQDAANGAVQTANEAQAGATAARTTANEAKLTADAAQTAAAQAGMPQPAPGRPRRRRRRMPSERGKSRRPRRPLPPALAGRPRTRSPPPTPLARRRRPRSRRPWRLGSKPDRPRPPRQARRIRPTPTTPSWRAWAKARRWSGASMPRRRPRRTRPRARRGSRWPWRWAAARWWARMASLARRPTR
ncbi:hypothetical protein WJ977_30905 [Achromobacter xylosoxidans]